MTTETVAPLLECNQLTQVYRVGASEVIALQGLDLEVAAGEIVGLVGASGSGKSTLMRVLSGLLRPAGGRVLFDGQDLGSATTRWLDTYRRREVGFVWQESGSNLIPYLTARQNVALPLELDGRGDALAFADELLDRVGLAARGGHRPSALSGGEQQRVALAVALVHRPRLLLADEPTGALDSATTSEVFDLMRSVGEESGLTQVIVSHDPELARHVDRAVAIRDGRVASERRWRSGADAEVAVDEVQLIDSIGRFQLTDAQRLALGEKDRIDVKINGEVVELRAADIDEDESSV